MGMFDYMGIEVPCPYCGRIVTGFQTKSGACSLVMYKPGDAVDENDSDRGYNSGEEPKSFSCHSLCDNCTVFTWIAVDIPVIDHIISEDVSKWSIKARRPGEA